MKVGVAYINVHIYIYIYIYIKVLKRRAGLGYR